MIAMVHAGDVPWMVDVGDVNMIMWMVVGKKVVEGVGMN